MLDEGALTRMVQEILARGAEDEWFECKQGNTNPDEIGENLSAVANGAALNGRPCGLVLWGIEDASHKAVGTSFDPSTAKKGNEALHAWLERMCMPRTTIRFHNLEINDVRVVVLQVPPPPDRPLGFAGTEYVRVGPTTRKLRDFPDRERRLWTRGLATTFELQPALTVEREALDDLLDLAAYAELYNIDALADGPKVFDVLRNDGLIADAPENGMVVTNLGACVIAKDIRRFPTIMRKTSRVVCYNGDSRSSSIRIQRDAERGYAVGFSGLLQFVLTQTQLAEEIVAGRRVTERRFPEIALREAIANSMIHQDFLSDGGGPLIEIFADRIEITNHGVPLVTPDRFLDSPSRSRNALLTDLMRRLKFCEELGTGVDKIVQAIELEKAPAPDFREVSGAVRVTLFAPRKFAEMDRESRLRGCYQHSSLRWESGRRAITNSSLRERFGVEKGQYTVVSKVLSDAVGCNLIKPRETAAKKRASYIPFWAT